MIVDFIVTRKEDDPIHYREVVDRYTEVNLIEVPYASTCADARRRSVHIGKSDYVMWFDPDDTLYENTLVRILDYLNNNPRCPGVMCLSDYIDPLIREFRSVVTLNKCSPSTSMKESKDLENV